jgi:hypothetical protein
MLEATSERTVNQLFLTERDVERYLESVLQNLKPSEVYEFIC